MMKQPPLMQIKTIDANHYAIEGALTRHTANQCYRFGANTFNTTKQVTFDCRAITQTDSAGVAVLLDWVRRCQHAHGQIQFTDKPTQMQAIIDVSHLSAFFNHISENNHG